jgi:hypothetical protein
MHPYPVPPTAPSGTLSVAHALARGVSRSFAQRGYATLLEFSLANGRRADVAALGRAGDMVIVEIKSSVEDFRADRKWPEYREFCDALYFAVPDDFPIRSPPKSCERHRSSASTRLAARPSPCASPKWRRYGCSG